MRKLRKKGILMINYEDFKKIELKVAKVLEAEEVAGAEKLLKLQIDLGAEKRQIVAGIKKVYAPKDLIGKEIVIVANLDTRMVMGIESQGMLLAASDDSGPVLLRPDKDVSPGSSIK
jgi:methionyl-tRNA synthetase